MLFMQPVNYQYNNENRPTTTNPVPTPEQQRVQVAILDDSLHPSKYLYPVWKLNSPEFESQDCLINCGETLPIAMLLRRYPNYFSTDYAALQI